MAYYKGSYLEQLAQLKILFAPAVPKAAAIAAEMRDPNKPLTYQGLYHREYRRRKKEQEQSRLEAHRANPIPTTQTGSTNNPHATLPVLTEHASAVPPTLAPPAAVAVAVPPVLAAPGYTRAAAASLILEESVISHRQDDDESDDSDDSNLVMKTDETSGSNDAKWRSELELLRQYKQEYGHCRVPRRYEIDGINLGKWLVDQRAAYKKHSEGKPAKITQERIDQLEAAGLDFNATQQNRGKDQKLPSDQHSSAITNTSSANYPSSASHPCSGRRQSSQPEPRRLNDRSRKAVALEHNLVFQKDDEPLIVSARFQDEKNPAPTCHHLSNLRAPLENRVTMSKGRLTTETALIARTLRKRVLPTAGQSTNTTPERSSPRLKRARNTAKHNGMLGFNLTPARHQSTEGNQSLENMTSRRFSKRAVRERSQSAHNPAVESIATATDTVWDEHFDLLVEFKWKHGHCRVPNDFCVDDSYYLGQWVVVQRLQHYRLMDGRPSSITADQVERLRAIGFVWKVR